MQCKWHFLLTIKMTTGWKILTTAFLLEFKLRVKGIKGGGGGRKGEVEEEGH